MKIVEKFFTAQAKAKGGRDGHVTSNNNVLDIDLSTPKEMGGPGKSGATNPEQLFAAGYAACFEGALGVAARQASVKLEGVTVEAFIGFGKAEDGGYGISADLHVNIPGLEQSQAEQLVEAAHGICPYSRATKGNIEVNLNTTTNAA
ncbi:organic hydroperoxide resistance protein [Hymenobacter taeanensis]|uniref:Organic hydroperoxide resistance protein n=1 Tax=Hymenobacter taeanensis TaxID=2735321 RepID=A0A6M6BIK7_9BACT|nr:MULTISPECIES: organic hydroperoxide resistance protein [Hymenobacter]QJX47956.1 organic hydroperoxide resistance protein [Hymenobacter taeanensis]UOQ82596.1 organic hydroperoxide resistance protein [Hymenobacter sp. 5414T-23]